MHQDSTHRQDLNQLVTAITKNLNSLKKILPQSQTPNNSAQQTKSSRTQKKLEKLEKNVQSLVRYSMLILQFAEKSASMKGKKEEELLRKKWELSETLKRMISLQDQSLILRKELNIKQKEIENLKMLNKVNVSYVSSVEMRESQRDESSVESEVQQKSFNSVQQSRQLGCYDSQLEYSTEQKEQQIEMVLEGEKNILCLLQSLSRAISFSDEEQEIKNEKN